jgi:hypothetical protein
MPPPRLKRSNTAGSAPASLEDGEIAINQADGKLYYHTAAGGVSTFLSLPTGHKATHATGGSDALSAADIGALTQATADSLYVNVTGDTMSGGLTINSATPLTVSGGRSSFAANSEPYGVGVRYVSSGGAVYFGATDGTVAPGVRISNAGGVALMSWTNDGAASIPGTLAVGGSSVVVTTDSRLSDARPPTAHTHGNITNAGAIGSTSGLPILTTTSGVLTTGSFGTTAGSFCQGDDSRLSDARTPTSHVHGNLTNAGAIGTTSGLPIITTTSGVLTAGAFGTASGSFCQGNDSRLSDSRTPTTHTHGNITNAGAIGAASGLPVITTTSGVLTTGTFGTTAASFCQGNDSRLSDSRTPLAHTQAASTITDFATEAAKYGPVTSVNGLTGAVTISAGSSISDGNKGDITVSGSGATWTINANAVITADIAGSAVTYAKIQNVSATDRLLGRSTAGAGVIEEITCTAFGRSVIAGADAAAVRTTINAVSKGGDTISGAVTVTGAITGQTGLSISGGRSLFLANNEPYGVGSSYGTGGGYVYFGAASAHSAPDAVISNAGGVGLMTIQNGGNVGVGTASPAVKLDVVGSARASTGILFGTDTASANTLSDYEEGTYTPSFVTGFSSVTMFSTAGRYIKIGKSVTAHMRLAVSAFTGNGATVSVSLPFVASGSSSGTIGGGFVHYSIAFATTAVSAPMIYGPDAGTSTAQFIKANSENFTASDFRSPGWTIGLTVLYSAD